MRRLLLPPALLLGLAAALHARPGSADSAPAVMTYVYNAPESALDVRYDYHWEILGTALERTRSTWGDYRMVKSETMSERRQAHELMHGSGKLSVMYLGTTPEFERRLIGVHIPVDRNLGGYSVLLVRRDRAGEFSNIHSVADLRRYSIGLGLGWVDVDILRHNGLRVVTGSSYDGLFEMLVHRRFDALLRAAVEVLDEQAQRKDSMPELYIEPNLIVYYPLPMYFWFANDAEGRRLAQRAEEGMRAMIADGTYDRIFDKYQRHKIERLDLKHRKVLRIENPFVGKETPLGDARLWFDPATYR